MFYPQQGSVMQETPPQQHSTPPHVIPQGAGSSAHPVPGRQRGTPFTEENPRSWLGALFHTGCAGTKHKSPSVVSQGLFSCLYSPR